MKPKSNYTRVMAGFYIFLCLIASMIVGELIYFLVIVPLVPKQTWLPLHECGLGLSCGYCLLQTDPPLYQMVEETGK